MRFAKGDQRLFGMIEQGPQMSDAAALRPARHARKPVDAAAAQQAKQNRLGLIVGMMGGDESIRADGVGVVAKRA